MRNAIGSLVVGLVLAASAADATPVFVGYPPPGGVVLGQSGNAGFGIGDITVPDGTVGRTNTYTGFDPLTGGYSSLWWAPTSLFGPLLSDFSPTSQPLTLSTITGNEAVFLSSSPWTISTVFGPVVYSQVRYELKTFTTAGAPINLTAAGSIPGLTGSLGAVLDVTPYLATGFKASYVFEAWNGSAWVGVDQLFNSLSTSCGGCVLKSVSAGFWTESVSAAAVPEPASLVMLGTGLIGIVRFRKLRRA